MTAIAERSTTNVVRLDDWRENRAEAIRVLQSSLYPGAKPESVELVLSYCEAARLDPFQKPVHLVPMPVKVGRKPDGDDQYEMRDTVMPGIGLYRIQASRTGRYAGKEKPVYGPLVTFSYKKKVTEWQRGQPTEKWVDVTLRYPEWCEVTVYKIVDGIRCPFTACEDWLENYASAGKYTDAPNAMWAKRPKGQLAKCTEAQALRMAFPDAVGAAPTAEEMEGRFVEIEDVRTIDSVAGVSEELMPRSTKEAAKADVIEANISATDRSTELPREESRQQSPVDEKFVTNNMLSILRRKAVANNVAEANLCTHFGIAALEKLPASKINEAMRVAAGSK